MQGQCRDLQIQPLDLKAYNLQPIIQSQHSLLENCWLWCCCFVVRTFSTLFLSVSWKHSVNDAGGMVEMHCAGKAVLCLEMVFASTLYSLPHFGSFLWYMVALTTKPCKYKNAISTHGYPATGVEEPILPQPLTSHPVRFPMAYVCGCVFMFGGSTYVTACIWRSEINFVQLVFSFAFTRVLILLPGLMHKKYLYEPCHVPNILNNLLLQNITTNSCGQWQSHLLVMKDPIFKYHKTVLQPYKNQTK